MAEQTLLIVDDDVTLGKRLARAMEQRDFVVQTADSVTTGKALAEVFKPAYAIIDLKLDDGSGLDVVRALQAVNAECRIVILTGFGNIATAVAAVKAGALDYLPKPANPDQIVDALLQKDGHMPPPADRVRWEHIQRVFEQCDRNVSETARRLKMHRRTLQRILAKHAPHN